MKTRKAEFPIRGPHEAVPLRIVSDAAVATPRVGDGRLIPLVIVDMSERPDLEELVRLHAELLRPGDHAHQWGQIPGHKRTLALFLMFKRPAELMAVLEFDLTRRAGLVDQIVSSRALYLQPGREGDRLATTFGSPKILVDVGECGFDDDWNKIYRKEVIRTMRDRGLGRKDAKAAAEQIISEWRRITNVRMRR